ncbi:MAG: protein translocase subunit SecF [Nitrospirota bacterium]|nr:protein translocase subunit SecF [Nitrospirota bacterium]
MEFFKKPNIDFIGKRSYAFAISGVFILLGLIALFQISRGAANMGIDFAGGTTVQLKFEKPIPLDEARKALDANGVHDAELQEFASDNKLLVRVRNDVSQGKVADQIVDIFSKTFADNKSVVDSSTEIGPTVGKTLRHDTLIAITIAILCIIIYIAFRFEFKFGVAATIAVFHDVMAVLGIFYMMNKEINLLFVTALLTLGGYSLTDTVVVFDRIRENIRAHRKLGTGDVINRSINEVLSRTVVVSLTTLLACVSLAVIGGEVIHDFAVAMTLGILVGTYSSIFVASPIVFLWRKKKKGKLG